MTMKHVALGIVAALYFRTAISRTILFWAAFILTRPLGATVGDFLDKPLTLGGLALGRFEASAVLAAAIAAGILLFPQRPGQHPGGSRAGCGRRRSTDNLILLK